jgi:hypothetical protein
MGIMWRCDEMSCVARMAFTKLSRMGGEQMGCFDKAEAVVLCYGWSCSDA